MANSPSEPKSSSAEMSFANKTKKKKKWLEQKKNQNNTRIKSEFIEIQLPIR